MSSTVPLQSSSMPLHVSVAGVPAVQLDGKHDEPVRAHAPTPHVAFGRPSSTAPLQLLSRASHTSVDGLVFRLHAIAPDVHAVVPCAQTPDIPVLQLMPPPGLPSSTVPSQSSSTPLQVSAPGA
jgi:hypothetical protein